MPKYLDNQGYDRLQYWTRIEIRRLYQEEGYETREATRLAQVLYDEIRKMTKKELYSWSKARDLEEPVGGINELAYLAAPFLISYADDLWFLIESMALPDNREVAHYEGLRGQRMRLSPEVKEVRKRARVEELRLEEEAEKHRRIGVLMRRADELRAAARAARERELIAEQPSPEH